MERSFEWRNEQFKDHDVDEEVYGDWRMIQGIATPMNMTRYKDGDMASQTFYTKVKYGDPMGPELFNPDAAVGEEVGWHRIWACRSQRFILGAAMIETLKRKAAIASTERAFRVLGMKS